MSNTKRFDEVRAMQERHKRILREGIEPLDDIAGELTEQQKQLYDEQRRREPHHE